MIQEFLDEMAVCKLSLIKDLEKNLKLGYENQYKKILASIAIGKKRFVRKTLSHNTSEYMEKYQTAAMNLVNYLINLFEVFGESAQLNAKKLFEENGQKWGKKLQKKMMRHAKKNDISFFIKSIYIDISNQDYIDMQNKELVWYFKKNITKSETEKYYGHFYEIKKAWLHAFIKAFSPDHISVFETADETDSEIVTNIIIKKASND